MGSNLISLRKHIHCRIVIESEAKHAADEKNISKKNHHLLPAVQQSISTEICSHCNHVNKTKYSFCTNCGYPLHDAVLADNYFKLLKEKKQLLHQAESAILIARIILYVMGACLLPGIFFGCRTF